MRLITLLIVFAIATFFAFPQTTASTENEEIIVSRDSLRRYFGTYEFTPQFRMRIFSENAKVFAQRIGDDTKFQIFSKKQNRFFLTAIAAELEFQKSSQGSYDILILHQDGKALEAHKIYAQPYELYDTVVQLDSALYYAYNKRDLKQLLSFFSADLEFYHDRMGLTDYKDNMALFEANFSKAAVMRRELIKGSLEVYPISGFGALQIGRHQFYQRNQEQGEKLVGEAKFVHVWKHANGNWKIVRILSYDH